MAKQLSSQQILYTEYVAGGMPEREAAIKVGYAEKYINQSLCRLRKDKRVNDRIEMLKNNTAKEAVISQQELMEHWSSIIRDPSISINQKTENSKLLAKALGMFIDRRQINSEIKSQAVMIIPDIANWEEYWEDHM